jgi:hypothetical protein
LRQSGAIVDDELFELLVRPLPAGCRLTVVFDCCHSGSGENKKRKKKSACSDVLVVCLFCCAALDLAHMYDADGLEIFPTDQAEQGDEEEQEQEEEEQEEEQEEEYVEVKKRKRKREKNVK